MMLHPKHKKWGANIIDSKSIFCKNEKNLKMYVLHVWGRFGSFWKNFDFYVYKFSGHRRNLYTWYNPVVWFFSSVHQFGILGFCSTRRGLFIQLIKEKFRGLQAWKQKVFSCFCFLLFMKDGLTQPIPKVQRDVETKVYYNFCKIFAYPWKGRYKRKKPALPRKETRKNLVNFVILFSSTTDHWPGSQLHKPRQRWILTNLRFITCTSKYFLVLHDPYSTAEFCTFLRKVNKTLFWSKTINKVKKLLGYGE